MTHSPTAKIQASESLKTLLAATAKPARPRAVPTGHMRERIAMAICGSLPTFFTWYPEEYVEIFLREPLERRQSYEEWADRLLLQLDFHGLEITDRRRDADAELKTETGSK
jgi:hypothetical protein